MKLLRFFDKFEDAVRGALSHWPIVYGFFGGVGIVLFWRGVWHTADFVSALLIARNGGNATIDFAMLPDGPVSLLLGSIILLSTGLFVSNFIGNEIIISGLRGEKKLTEKTEVEVRTETGAIAEIQDELKDIRDALKDIKESLKR
jgi:hypothetical protein